MADICPFFGVVLSQLGRALRAYFPIAQNHPKKGANIGRRVAAASIIIQNLAKIWL
jgi:hypothetical protein